MTNAPGPARRRGTEANDRRHSARQGGSDATRRASKELGKQAVRHAGKQLGKRALRHAAVEGGLAAATGGTSAIAKVAVETGVKFLTWKRAALLICIPLLPGMIFGAFTVMAIAASTEETPRSSPKHCRETAPVRQYRTNAASRRIPARFLTLYRHAGGRYQIPWNVLAAIGRVESGHRANPGTSSAGALGPMQFMPATWAAYSVDGNDDGRKDVMEPADAIPAAARYLKASGAPRKMRRALWHYNHSWDYVDMVLRYAHQYAGGSAESDSGSVKCERQPEDMPSEAGAKVVAYAKKHIGLPYQWGGGDYKGPTTGSPAHGTSQRGFDCSGLVLYAVYRATNGRVRLPHNSDTQSRVGKRIARSQIRPGDTIGWDTDGSGGYDHIAIYAGRSKVVVAPHTGAKVRIQPLRDFARHPASIRRHA